MNLHRISQDYKKYQDRTEDLDKELIKNQTEAKGMNFFRWLNNVRPYGKWDYKNNEGFKKEYGKKFIYAGYVLTPEDFGNINFGLAGKMRGSSLETLEAGAGVLSFITHGVRYPIGTFFDDPKDQYWIEYGYKREFHTGG